LWPAIYNLLGGQMRDRIRTYNTCASYGTLRDYEAFHERPDELAECLLAEGITAMKIWPFDVFARRPTQAEIQHQGRRQGTVGSARTLVGPVDGAYISPLDLDRGVDAVRRIRQAVGTRMEIAIEMHAMWNYPSALLLARSFSPRARSCGCRLMRRPRQLYRLSTRRAERPGSGTASADLGDLSLLHSHRVHCQLRRELKSPRW
jgi:hypothetical protein